MIPEPSSRVVLILSSETLLFVNSIYRRSNTDAVVLGVELNVEFSCLCLWPLPSALWIVGALREPPEIASWWTPSVIGWSSSRWGIISPTDTRPLSWFGCHCYLLIHMSMNAPEASSTKTKRSRTFTDANWKRDILRASAMSSACFTWRGPHVLTDLTTWRNVTGRQMYVWPKDQQCCRHTQNKSPPPPPVWCTFSSGCPFLHR